MGFFCGMVIGLSIGMICATQFHAVEGLVFGPILGVICGMILERYSSSRVEINGQLTRDNGKIHV